MDPKREAERRVGAMLRGKWRLEKLLGVGGMAAVYVGVHKIGRRDAIKILHPDVAASPELRARFEQEAHAVNRFVHPGAVEIRDIDKAEDNAPFLVMELLEGEPLTDRAQRDGGMAPDEVLRITDELLDVLAAAHAQGIVHRDIKLDNLFLTREGKLKVLDFGIARVRDAGQNHPRPLTRVGATLGTLSYMSPEQIKGGDIDGRADLFSVGATMFRLVARRRLHEAGNESELLIKMATVQAPKLASVAKDAPPGLCLVVDRALKIDRNDRYPDATTMQADVRAARAGSPPPYATTRADAADTREPSMGAPGPGEPALRPHAPLPIAPTQPGKPAPSLGFAAAPSVSDEPTAAAAPKALHNAPSEGALSAREGAFAAAPTRIEASLAAIPPPPPLSNVLMPDAAPAIIAPPPASARSPDSAATASAIVVTPPLVLAPPSGAVAPSGTAVMDPSQRAAESAPAATPIAVPEPPSSLAGITTQKMPVPEGNSRASTVAIPAAARGSLAVLPTLDITSPDITPPPKLRGEADEKADPKLFAIAIGGAAFALVLAILLIVVIAKKPKSDATASSDPTAQGPNAPPEQPPQGDPNPDGVSPRGPVAPSPRGPIAPSPQPQPPPQGGGYSPPPGGMPPIQFPSSPGKGGKGGKGKKH